ncbi:MAG: heavy-metal-associated domain-containing protein [Thermodesulfovibrionales bacterium]|nr:heavy-metal-associated domain-containing protein [Thermodesulfovibrionales bacterium]
MKRLLLNVQKEFCEECSIALRRFIGRMPGVESIETESGRIEIKFNDSLIKEEELLKLTKDSIEKLGYKLNEDNA